MLVLGAGLQGCACAYDLLQNPDVERVVLGDSRAIRLPAYLEPYRKDPRLVLATIDARDAGAVSGALEVADACLNALPYYYNYDVTKLAVTAGTHCCDLGGNTEIVERQLDLDREAKRRGVCVIPDCGLAPGMVNILAAQGIGTLASTDSVRIYVGGLPQHPKPPINYQVVYSLEGVLDYYTSPSWVLSGGELRQVEALSGVEPVAFPDPIGTLEAFHTAGGLSTMAATYRETIPEMSYKTLRYPGHAELMRAIRGLGLLDLHPVRVGEQEVIPRQVFIACAEPRLRRPEDRDLVALRVEVSGTLDRPVRIVYDLIDYYDEATGIGAMGRTTGFSLSVTGQFQVTGRIGETGVATPDRAVPADAYIDALAARGIVIERRIEPAPA